MNIDQLSVNTLRFLSVEAIQKAKSGHPGLPMGAAPAAYALWAKNMRMNPADPKWDDRDRFVLSAGHGSALLYSLLHLFGYNITIDDLKNFRQLDSNTPGHPEYDIERGIETASGPLGQGIAGAVGMAIAETYLAAQFNRPGYDVVNHYTYALCGDGCLMEGVSAEAASLAGTLKLGKLVVLYDCNNITIEGDTCTSFTEDVLKRFEAYGWQTITVEDGNDVDAIDKAIKEAKAEADKPSIIKIMTKIGYGAPNKQGKASAHGEPLGEEEIVLAKENLGWEYKEDFYVPEQVKENISDITKAGAETEKEWKAVFEAYAKEYPELAEQWNNWHNGELPDLLNNEDYWTYEGDIATRASSEKVLNKLSKLVPNLIGGSADLAPSNKSVMKDREYYSPENRTGSNMHFGIREFAMTVIANGMYLHGGLRPYIAGFFVFSDYMKAGLRMSALMGLPVISIFTHDSIGVGEDGPTHEPIEQLAQFRAMPGVSVMRPCDRRETAAAWKYAMESKNEPVILVLSRQNLAQQDTSSADISKGAYILQDSKNEVPELILMSSGSEIGITVEAADKLRADGVDVRVVSVPCMDLFEKQSKEYKESVLPDACRKRVSVEALSSFGWAKYTGLDGANVAIDRFGESAPAGQLFEHFGFTSENIVNTCKDIL